MDNPKLKIYQAPLQGFTDFTFRKVFSEVFGGIDKYFIPYLTYAKGREIKKSALKEVFPENNVAQPVVPQVLFSDAKELIDLVTILVNYGYHEINLNLGCPYPMAINKGRGVAWLEKPESFREILELLFNHGFQADFSVKMRAGITNNQDARAIFNVLNRFPITEIIFHPRTANQIYSGKANSQLFSEAISLVKHPMIYNGDLFLESDLLELRTILPEQTDFMIGRGLLMDPSLPLRLKGKVYEPNEQRKKMKEFHDLLLEGYSARLEGSGHILMKMNQFWTYFSQSFDNPHKAMKLVKKSSNLLKYNAAVVEIFRSF
jgi:tRNA-dihydrouridine synthase